MLVSSIANAATYYVKPTGLDTNPGTYTAPFKTIAKALLTAVDYDTVYLLTGTFTEEVSINQNHLTFSALPGSTPVIDNASLPDSDWHAILNVNGNYNNVYGIELKNSNMGGKAQGGYGAQVSGHHNTLTRMKAHHTWGAGIIVNGDYGIVEESTIYQASQVNFNGAAGAAGNGWGTGLSAARNDSPDALVPGITSYPTLRRNKVYNNWGEGLSCFETSHCLIEENIVYDNWAVNLYLSDSTYSTINRNMVYESSAPAIVLGGGGDSGITLADEVSNGTTIPYSTNNTVANNFVYNTDIQAFSWTQVPNTGLVNVKIIGNTIANAHLNTGEGGDPAIVNSGSQIRNNIIAQAGSDVPSNTGITFSNNNWAGSAPPAAATGSDVIGFPQLNRSGVTTPGNLSPTYFKLQSISPNIDAGVSVSGFVRDYFKSDKVAPVDIGGHEYDGTQYALTQSNISAFGVSNSVGTVKWTTSTATTAVVQYGLRLLPFPWSVSVTTPWYTHGISIGGLAANTTYYYRIVSTDPYTGSQVTSAVYYLTTTN